MNDFSDDELPDISFTTPSKSTPGKCTDNNLKQDQKILTPKLKQENKIVTALESELEDITNDLKELTDGSLKVTNLSPQLSTPSSHDKKKWRRHSSPIVKDNSPSSKSYISSRMPNIPLANTPTSIRIPSTSHRHASISPSTSNRRTLNIGGSPLSPLAQRCFQKLNGEVHSSLKERYTKEQPQKQNNINLDNTASSIWNATSKLKIISKISPLIKEKKINQIPVNHQNELISSNGTSGTFNSGNENIISREIMSTPPTGKINSAAENMSTPPSRKKKFGIESSPGSDLLERCLKKLGYDDNAENVMKNNVENRNVDSKKMLYNKNNEPSKLGPISDIKQKFSFEMDDENIENELSNGKIASLSAKSDVTYNRKSNSGSELTKTFNGKSWIEDYNIKSEVFHNETMLSIISETTKKCRCSCRRGDCSRKTCSCKRSGGTCGSHCGCQLSICKNRTETKASPSSRKVLVTPFDNPNLSPKRIEISPVNMMKNSVQPASNRGITSPSCENTFVDSNPKDEWLKSFRLIDNPVNATKTNKEVNSLCSRTPLPADKNVYNGTCNKMSTDLMISNISQNSKVITAKITNEALSSAAPNLLCKYPNTSNMGETTCESRMNSLQSESSCVSTNEYVDTNSHSDLNFKKNNESTLVNESRSKDQTQSTIDDKGNPVLLIPESLSFLRNACESSVANPDNKSTTTNSTNDLSIDIENGTMQEPSTSQSENASSLLDMEIFETSLNSNASTLLDETGLFENNSLDETVPYSSNLMNETVPYHNNLLDETVPYTGNLVKKTLTNDQLLERSTILFQMGPTRKIVENTNQAEKISKQRPSCDDLGYASDTQPPIKRIKIGQVLNENVKKEVDSGLSWDQIKQEKPDLGEVSQQILKKNQPGTKLKEGVIQTEKEQLYNLMTGQQEINSNPKETPGCSKESWHRPYVAMNSLQERNSAQEKQDLSSPVCIKKEDGEILPETLVKVLLRTSNMTETKSNLLNEFHPAPLNKVINENPQLFKVQLCMVADVQVILAPNNVSLCGGHSGPDGCRSRATCTALHICPNFVDSKCLDELCIFGHSFYTNHNKGVLKKLHLENVDAAQLCKLLKPVIKISEPKHLLDICKYYNTSGCDNQRCNNLHVCLSFVIGKCKCSRVNCSLNHNILNDKCRELLSNAGIDTNETPRDIMVALLALNSAISETSLK